MKIPRSKLNTRLEVQRAVADDSFDGAGSGTWAPVRKVWAEVQDVLPSRAERQDDGYTDSAWRARVRMDYRTDITSAMRFVGRGRVVQIISGPAKVEAFDAIEFMVEEASPAGGGA